MKKINAGMQARPNISVQQTRENIIAMGNTSEQKIISAPSPQILTTLPRHLPFIKDELQVYRQKYLGENYDSPTILSDKSIISDEFYLENKELVTGPDGKWVWK